MKKQKQSNKQTVAYLTCKGKLHRDVYFCLLCCVDPDENKQLF